MRLALVVLLAAACSAPAVVASPSPTASCAPTAGRSPARVAVPSPRPKMGEGFRVSGVVRGEDCRPLVGARVYAWLANPEGVYDTAHEGGVSTDAQGRYSFESSFPGIYGGAAPHVHVQVQADGHETIELEILPRQGDTSATQDFVLRRSGS
jgi:protocatechuate 3,4-dioxygenase beta subunit